MAFYGSRASTQVRRGTTVLAWVASGVIAVMMLAARPALSDDGGCCGGEKKDGDKPTDASSAEGKTDASKAAGLLVDLGNKKCPVMGGKPDGKTWSEWNGLRIGHCCGMCLRKFAADPEQFLKQTGVDWKAALAAVKKVDEATGADRDKALAELKKKWTVVDAPVVAAPPKGTLIDLANVKCPVMGGKPDGETFSEWNGVRVGHCCPGCTKKFAVAPEKYLNDAGIQWKAAAEAAKAVDGAKGAEREKALAELKKKWTVVRPPAPEDAKKPEEPSK